jgi:hypothetical protein
MIAYFTAAPDGAHTITRYPVLAAWWEIMSRPQFRYTSRFDGRVQIAVINRSSLRGALASRDRVTKIEPRR